MNEFDNIISLKNDKEKKDKLILYYKNEVNVDEWLTISNNISIINFKDRVEYKKFNKYHRLNGPAIDYNNEELNKYYYRGIKYDNKNDWEKVTIKEMRKIKIKKLNKSSE
jgi:hypothetical protein